MGGDVTQSDAYLVAFRDARGRPVGLGVLAADRDVLTCAHVVNAALGRPDDAAEPPTGEIPLSWPKLPGSPSASGDIVAWRSLADGDLARVRLRTDPPAGAQSALLQRGSTDSAAALRVFGYPDGRPRGQWAKVQVVATVEGGWLQLNSLEPTTPDVRAGFSGSPVHDPRSGAVIGLIAEAPGRGSDSLAIPTAELLGFEAPVDASAANTQRRGRTYGPAPELTILHLSDPQFGDNHVFGSAGATEADRDRDSLFGRLHEDLRKLSGQHGLHPDLVVVTGDLTERAMPSEFTQVLEFLERLTDAVGLPRDRVVLVPGNHDINRLECQRYFLEEQIAERAPVRPYAAKWTQYASAFDKFYSASGLGPDLAPEFTLAQPWTLHELPELRVVVSGLNSTMAESHRAEDHYGEIGEGQLAWFAERLRPYRDAGWLVVGAVHHNPVRGATADDENLRDTADLDRVLGNAADAGGGLLHLLLHGHTHDGQVHQLSSGLLVLSTGSAAVHEAARPPAVPNQYQLLTLRPDGLTRYTRAYVADRKSWSGDNRADIARDDWRHTRHVAFTAPASLADAPRVEAVDSDHVDDVGRRDAGTERHQPERYSDPFLDEVAEVTRLRYPGAEVTLEPSRQVGRSHLRVADVDNFAQVARWPVGAVAGVVTKEVLDTFVNAVHRQWQSSETALRSHLVHGGAEPDDTVREEAVAAGVRLHSLAEYSGLIDLDRVRRKQRETLNGDQRYPADRYVPQRFRTQYPGGERDADGNPVVLEDLLRQVTGWLGEDGARFVTVLGDFGRGKSYLIRQLLRTLPQTVGGLEPLLLELRHLKKGPDLYDLVGQRLRRLDVGDVTDAKLRHLVSRGRVALLLDGFDELVQRASYDTAAAYLGTLLAAATGEAKIVLTSRSQHFGDNKAVRAQLLETSAGRDASRIVVLEDFTDDQIQQFLLDLYGGNEARARRRFDRLSDINDLLGLSRNPRMLTFIAALPDEELDEAQRSGDRIGAADLYRTILGHWLRGEVDRQNFTLGRTALTAEDRMLACRTLALRLWAGARSGDELVRVDELTSSTREALLELETLGFTDAQAAHTIGSGSLLTLDGDGFGFVHRSVMEWLVADAAAGQLRGGGDPTVLLDAEMSDLMTDFFCDLAGHEAAYRWAQAEHRTGAGRANATRIGARLRRRDDAQLVPGDGRVDLRGSDLRDQDVAAYGRAAGGGTGLQGALLSDTTWARMTLRGLDLAGADLTSADLRDTRLSSVDLMNARLRNARLSGAVLAKVDLRAADLTGADLTRTRMVDVDLTGAEFTGSRWNRAGVAGVLDFAALEHLAERRGHRTRSPGAERGGVRSAVRASCRAGSGPDRRGARRLGRVARRRGPRGGQGDRGRVRLDRCGGGGAGAGRADAAGLRR